MNFKSLRTTLVWVRFAVVLFMVAGWFGMIPDCFAKTGGKDTGQMAGPTVHKIELATVKVGKNLLLNNEPFMGFKTSLEESLKLIPAPDQNEGDIKLTVILHRREVNGAKSIYKPFAYFFEGFEWTATDSTEKVLFTENFYVPLKSWAGPLLYESKFRMLEKIAIDRITDISYRLATNSFSPHELDNSKVYFDFGKIPYAKKFYGTDRE